MEEPSEKVDPVEDPETPQTKDEEDTSDDSEILQPETLVKVMKKLSLNSSAKRSTTRRQSLHQRIERLVENRSQNILREVQSAFPKRRVRTLLLVLKGPVARVRGLFGLSRDRKGLKAKSLTGTVGHSDVSALSAIIKDGILLRMLKSGRIRTT